MSSLKDLRNRMASVRATQKITRAMQMVAASRMRSAQEKAENARLYSEHMSRLLLNLQEMIGPHFSLPLAHGNGQERSHLLIVCTAERGLCGGFNTRIVRLALDLIQKIQLSGKHVKIMTIGKKGHDFLKRECPELLVDRPHFSDLRKILFSDAHLLVGHVVGLFEKGEFDLCTLVYSQFISATTQVPVAKPLIPFLGKREPRELSLESISLYEGAPGKISADLVLRHMTALVFSAFLENSAGEMGARMIAMDNATRNAGDMIRSLSIIYNRQRQTRITNELIEIISGAEVL